jgi:hypothetical protein
MSKLTYEVWVSRINNRCVEYTSYSLSFFKMLDSELHLLYNCKYSVKDVTTYLLVNFELKYKFGYITKRLTDYEREYSQRCVEECKDMEITVE